MKNLKDAKLSLEVLRDIVSNGYVKPEAVAKVLVELDDIGEYLYSIKE